MILIFANVPNADFRLFMVCLEAVMQLVKIVAIKIRVVMIDLVTRNL